MQPKCHYLLVLLILFYVCRCSSQSSIPKSGENTNLASQNKQYDTADAQVNETGYVNIQNYLELMVQQADVRKINDTIMKRASLLRSHQDGPINQEAFVELDKSRISFHRLADEHNNNYSLSFYKKGELISSTVENGRVTSNKDAFSIDDLYDTCEDALKQAPEKHDFILSFDERGILNECGACPKDTTEECRSDIDIERLDFGIAAYDSALEIDDSEIDAFGDVHEKSDTESLTCYDANYDKDGDKFAANGAPSNKFERSRSDRFICPTGWVPGRYDCNDNDENIHPGSNEIMNSVDDDCDGFIDETTYSFAGWGVTDSSYEIRGVVNSISALLYYSVYLAPLLAKITYGKLSEYPTTHTTGYMTLNLDSSDGDSSFILRLNGLSEATVYRSKITIYAHYQGQYIEIVDGINDNGQAYDGKYDNWHFVTTTREDHPTSEARTYILLYGFRDYSYNINDIYNAAGIISGYNGRPFRAANDDAWCSEFYSFNASSNLDMGIKDTVDEIESYFGDHFHKASTEDDLKSGNEAANRADWLKLSDGEHSGMFLAIDKDNRIWSLEGNATNGTLDISHMIAIKRTRASSAGLKGWGHISASHLK